MSTVAEQTPVLRSLKGRIYRMTANMEQLATLGYVDSLAEQAVLERLLEGVKPPYPSNAQNLHYLLKTPFRYPSLPSGTLLSRPHEPGLFYGGGSQHAALADAAYARLMFVHSITSVEANVLQRPIRTEHTLVQARYASEKGVTIDANDEVLADWYPPLSRQLADNVQRLGSALRMQGVEVLECRIPRLRAARRRAHAETANVEPVDLESIEAGDYKGEAGSYKGIAVFSPQALTAGQPLLNEQWLCETRRHEVMFSRVGDLQCYCLEDFS